MSSLEVGNPSLRSTLPAPETPATLLQHPWGLQTRIHHYHRGLRRESGFREKEQQTQEHSYLHRDLRRGQTWLATDGADGG